MENRIPVYAEALDVVSALELKYNQVEGAFSLENLMSLVNMGCIRESDGVLVLASQVKVITEAIAYLYVPRQLAAAKIYSEKSNEDWKITAKDDWKEIRALLNNYVCTEPNFMELHIDELQLHQSAYDVIIGGYLVKNLSYEQKEYSRFQLEGGMAYEVFERILVNANKVLSDEGRLLLLARPSWILKSWQLLEELGLQLEYQQYHVYAYGNREPNTLVWLRLVKCEKGFDIEKQKRNLLRFMEDNNVDRLFAHRNNLIFPYVELSYKNSEVYVQVEQNLEYLQYFFSTETTKELAGLCEGYTACLVTPSIAVRAYNDNKNIVLFERDNRFREKGGLKFVKYDLEKGLTELTRRRFYKKFDRVICDPPFDIRLDVLARDIEELIKLHKDSIVYVVFPDKRKVSLVNAMKAKGFSLTEEEEKINIEYGRPPKLVRMYGKQAIQIYKFVYASVK